MPRFLALAAFLLLAVAGSGLWLAGALRGRHVPPDSPDLPAPAPIAGRAAPAPAVPRSLEKLNQDRDRQILLAKNKLAQAAMRVLNAHDELMGARAVAESNRNFDANLVGSGYDPPPHADNVIPCMQRFASSLGPYIMAKRQFEFEVEQIRREFEKQARGLVRPGQGVPSFTLPPSPDDKAVELADYCVANKNRILS